MASTFYVHRLSKLLDEFVVGTGLSVHITDDYGLARLQDHVVAAKAIAEAQGVTMTVSSEQGRTILTFSQPRRK